MRLIRNSKAFTLVEVLIVVAILGLLAAIAVPNFMKARTDAAAGVHVANIRAIEDAVDRYAIDKKKDTGDAIAAADFATGEIFNELKGGALPTSPIAGKQYTIKSGANYGDGVRVEVTDVP